MKIWYDWEFLEDGKTIEPISIGMVREDDAEYYAINGNLDRDKLIRHSWLMGNVVPSLPLAIIRSMSDLAVSGRLEWNFLHPDSEHIRTPHKMAAEVHDFIQGGAEPPTAEDEDGEDAELWAYYAAYDHVCLCQLWGSMVKLPEGIPMFTYDLKQYAMMLGNPKLPVHDNGTEHRAIDDARWNRKAHKFLDNINRIT